MQKDKAINVMPLFRGGGDDMSKRAIYMFCARGKCQVTERRWYYSTLMHYLIQSLEHPRSSMSMGFDGGASHMVPVGFGCVLPSPE